jgi:hypothetical protein
VRLDSRGNKQGIDAQFSVHKEKLAFIPQQKLNEMDYPIIFVKPHPKTITVLEEHTDALEMYQCHLPEYL